MTNREVINLFNALYTISKYDSLNVDVTTCFLLAKNKRTLEPLCQSILETRKVLFNKYGQPDRNDQIIVPQQDVAAFTEEYDRLMNIPVDVELNKIPIENLKGLKLKMDIMEDLLPIIEYKK